MIGSKIHFAYTLKEKVLKKEERELIGEWAYQVLLDGFGKNDSEFEELLLVLNKMEIGPEFFLSYEDLELIANKIFVETKVL